jgi:predicted transcriptional regulator
MTLPPTNLDLGGYVSNIVSAYVANHGVEASALPGLIQSVQRAFAGLSGGTGEQPREERPQPAVPIKKSVFPTYIVCLEDGKKLKMMKRHLKTAYNMEPDEYRQRWGLPHDYPMVAPDYAAQRSRLAKKIGLGRKPQPEPEIIAEPEPVVRHIPEGRRGAKRVKTFTVGSEA